jgi:hypothetical protein
MVHALGRSFNDFPNRSTAENEVVASAREGRVARFGTKIPDASNDANLVRAGLVRFLALGGDERTSVHEREIHIEGAWIEGHLDLEGCRVVRALRFNSCKINGAVILLDADLVGLELDRSVVRRVIGDRLRCGSLFLRDGFHATGIGELPADRFGDDLQGTVRLITAHITGDLLCEGGRIVQPSSGAEDAAAQAGGPEQYALVCEQAKIDGRVFLCNNFSAPGMVRNSFEARGTVSFRGAQIGGILNCGGGTFDGAGSAALDFRWAEIGGGLDLDGSRLAGDLICDHAEIGNALIFRNVHGIQLPGQNAEGPMGRVSLLGAHAQELSDESASWERTRDICLDGFEYDRIAEVANDAGPRIAWLNKQVEAHRQHDFRPQPWEHLIKVLREMGYLGQATAIAIEKQKQLRRAGKTGLPGYLHDAYGLMYGYGYQPLKLASWAVGVALLLALFFWMAAARGVMAPTDRRIFDDNQFASCKQGRVVIWTKCDVLQYKYTVFNPLLYSLELILPIAGLQQTKDWAPLLKRPCVDPDRFGICWSSMTQGEKDTPIQPKPGFWPLGVLATILARFENLFGWLAGLMFVAVATGLVKKD